MARRNPVAQHRADLARFQRGSAAPARFDQLHPDGARPRRLPAAGAAGATIGGMIIFGPIGAIGGAFVTGKSVVIPVGATTFVQVANDVTVEGLVQTTNKDTNIFPETTSTKPAK